MRTTSRKGKLLRLTAKVAVVFVVFFMLIRWFEHSQVYHPSADHYTKPDVLGQHEDIFIGDDPRIHAWFFPARPGATHSDVAFLVCHGNGGNISHRLDTAQALLDAGAAVLLFDYRGYGRSTGRPSEEGTYRDAQAAYRWLRTKGFEGTNIVALGESLGGGIATELAIREKLGGLILQSTFTCMTDIGAELFPWLPVRWMCSIKYDTCKKLPKLNIPIAVMHSRDDQLINFRHAERNFACAKEPKIFCELKGDHNVTVEVARDEFIAGVQQLLGLMRTTAIK